MKLSRRDLKPGAFLVCIKKENFLSKLSIFKHFYPQRPIYFRPLLLLFFQNNSYHTSLPGSYDSQLATPYYQYIVNTKLIKHVYITTN